MAVTHNRYKLKTVSLPKNVNETAISLMKPPCGGFRSETQNRHLDPEVV
jgi:hypothetical protein